MNETAKRTINETAKRSMNETAKRTVNENANKYEWERKSPMSGWHSMDNWAQGPRAQNTDQICLTGRPIDQICLTGRTVDQICFSKEALSRITYHRGLHNETLLRRPY